MVTISYPPEKIKYYRIFQKHAEEVAKNQFKIQLSEHLKKGRKKSTFKFHPTHVQEHLIKISSDILGGKISIESAMSYVAHDYDFKKERYG